MSQRFLEGGQFVGYIFEDKKLIVTVSEKMAKKLKADGWDVHFEAELGHFVRFVLEG